MAGFSQSWAGHARAVPADLCPFVSLLAHLFPFAWFLPHTVTGSSSPMLVSAEQTPGAGEHQFHCDLQLPSKTASASVYVRKYICG